MKFGGKTLICLLCVIALTPKVRAVVNDSPSGDETKSADGSDSPYSAIWLRNVFDLKPPIPPKANDVVTNTPPPNVELTGITTLLGTKRALFMVQDPPSPGKPPGKDESYILTEGERQGVLEVLEINPKDKTVKIKVSDLVSTITFKTNKPPVGAQAAVTPGGGIPRPPSFNPAGFNPGAPGALPTRMMRPTADASPYSPQGNQYNNNYNNSQNAYNQQAGQAGYLGGYAQAGAAATSTPGLALPGFGGSTPTQQNAIPPASAPPEITGAILNLQKAAADNAGSPFPPLPPPFQVQESPTGSGSGGSSSSETPPTPPTPVLGQRTTGNFPSLPPMPP